MRRTALNTPTLSLMGAAILIGLGACDWSRGPTGPVDGAVGGETVVSSMWIVGEAGLQYGGAVSGPDGLGWAAPLSAEEDWKDALLAEETLREIRESIAAGGLVRLGEEGGLPATRGADQLTRYRFRAPDAGAPLTQRMEDGSEVKVVFTNPSGRSGRPPSAMLVYVDGVLGSLNEFTYERRGIEWASTSIKTTSFDESGAVLSIVNTDVRGLTPPRRLAGASVIGHARAGLSRLACEVRDAFGPTEVYAAVVRWGCSIEAYSLTLALTAQAAAIATSLGIAATCVVTLASCPAYLGSLVAVALATAAVNIAKQSYDQCMAEGDHSEDDGGDFGGGGGGGGGGDPLECYTIIIEVSGDGGLTWDVVGVQTICN